MKTEEGIKNTGKLLSRGFQLDPIVTPSAKTEEEEEEVEEEEC